MATTDRVRRSLERAGALAFAAACFEMADAELDPVLRQRYSASGTQLILAVVDNLIIEDPQRKE